MSLFEITTRSIFENVYVVESDTLEGAIHIVLHEDVAPEFYQKHLGESAVRTRELCSGDPIEADFDIANTAIRERGYI